MNTLILQHTIDPERAFQFELARLRSPVADPVITARRNALADAIEKCRDAYAKRGAKP